LFALAQLGELYLHERRSEIRQLAIPVGPAFDGESMTAMMKVWGIRLRKLVSERLASVQIGKMHASPPPGKVASALPSETAMAGSPTAK
jgi:hypothetical protein